MAQQVGGEELRSLDGAQARAGQGGQDKVALDLLDGVRDRQAGDDSADSVDAVGQAVQEGLRQTGREKGAGAVVDQDAAAVPRQGGQAQTHGVLAPFAAGNGQDGHAGGEAGLEVREFAEAVFELRRGKDDDHAREAGYRGHGRDAAPVEGASLQGQELLARAARLAGQARTLARGQDDGPE